MTDCGPAPRLHATSTVFPLADSVPVQDPSGWRVRDTCVPGGRLLSASPFFGSGLGGPLLFFNQLGGAIGTTGLLELRQPLRTILIHRVVLELLLVSARPDHHRPGHDFA